MPDKKCCVCLNSSKLFVTKGITNYFQCSNCRTLFCEPLDNSDLVGGEFELERNEKENNLRISRINEMVFGMNKDDVYILDFGCGHGRLIEDLKIEGYKNTDGYDAYYEPYSMLPQKNKYHIVSMVECIEHTSSPFVELDVIHRSLLKGGVVMIETSFINIAEQENIPLEDFFYVNPKAGHSTIFSHHGLDVLMLIKGFLPMQHFNRHVRLYKKLDK